MKFVIDQEVAQGIADYLVTRPYNEVAGYMNALLGLQEVPDPAVQINDPEKLEDSDAPEESEETEK